MKPKNGVSVYGWGSYVPPYRLTVAEVSRVWGRDPKQYEDELNVKEKAVAGPDEDSATMAVEAAKNALARASVQPSEVGAVYVGSESPPYAVKPTATTVAEALGIGPLSLAADLEFACKAGTEGLQAAIGLVGSGMVKYGLAIGSDTAQGGPGDHLEYTAASGATALVVGPLSPDAAASLEGSVSFVSDTPDFWRRYGAKYPSHGEGFTGEPAYFKHVEGATRALLEELGLKPSDFDYVVFHQPNGRYPLTAARDLGFSPSALKVGLLSPFIGNTYAAASITGFSAVLDVAKPGQRVLLTSFGSGAGSDSFSFVVTDGIEARRPKAKFVMDYVKKRVEIDYALYLKYRGGITLGGGAK
ncbi:MAG: hydroxymethylglutaryl-CoA synthase [Candidatus Marsarchaeota archaeon]